MKTKEKKEWSREDKAIVGTIVSGLVTGVIGAELVGLSAITANSVFKRDKLPIGALIFAGACTTCLAVSTHAFTKNADILTKECGIDD